MRKKTFLLVFMVVLAMSAFLIGSAAAQEVDIDSMDNAQLMQLLQSIINKLETDEAEEPAPEPADPVPSDEEPETEITVPEVPEPASIQEAEAGEEPKITIYENKKLIIGRMPDSYFVPKDSGGGEKKDNPPSKKKPPRPPSERPDPLRPVG